MISFKKRPNDFILCESLIRRALVSRSVGNYCREAPTSQLVMDAGDWSSAGLAVKPEEMNFIMPDIDPYSLGRYSREWLQADYCNKIISKKEMKERTAIYLQPASSAFNPLPVAGKVVMSKGQNHRMLVNLACSYADHPAINVVFVIDTLSPFTFLSQEVVEALDVPLQDNKTPFSLHIHSKDLEPVNCYASPAESSFSHVNILGVDFFTVNGLKLVGRFFIGLTKTRTVEILQADEEN